jgi:hypothetical protein
MCPEHTLAPLRGQPERGPRGAGVIWLLRYCFPNRSVSLSRSLPCQMAYEKDRLLGRS